MRKIIIMGAGGRDFHNFNTVFRHDPNTEVVAFTAAQIPGIDAAATRPPWPVRGIRTGSQSGPSTSLST